MTPLHINGKVVQIPGILVPFLGLLFVALVIVIFTCLAGALLLYVILIGIGVMVSGAVHYALDKLFPPRRRKAPRTR